MDRVSQEEQNYLGSTVTAVEGRSSRNKRSYVRAYDACLANGAFIHFVGIGREMLSHFGWICTGSLLAATVWRAYSLLLFICSFNFGERAETFALLVSVMQQIKARVLSHAGKLSPRRV